jgi:hypothetical protein
MKKLFIYIIPLFLAACDKVDGPYSESSQQTGVENDTIKKVLLEDYTGINARDVQQHMKKRRL